MARFRRRTFVRRRGRSKLFWIRGQEAHGTPLAVMDQYDLLGRYRTTAGISLNIPEITIWRIHIRISVRFTISAGGDNPQNGILTAVFVEQNISTALNDPAVAAFAYGERYLMYDTMYTSEQLAVDQVTTAAGVNTIIQALERTYDIKSHRRLDNLDDTLWLTLSPLASVQDMISAITYSILVRQA
jgi:hypothetical protein